MTSPTGLQFGLKEWDVVIRALLTGRQILLLRKGGILEQGATNRFAITHDSFVFFPTLLHQSRGELKAEAHPNVQPASAEPTEVTLTAAAAVTDIFKVQSRQQIDRLDAEHIWSPSLIDMRFNYKPQNPLFLVVVRTFQLAEPIALRNTPAFAGCKSWVPLDHPIDATTTTAALSDNAFELRRQAIRAALDT